MKTEASNPLDEVVTNLLHGLLTDGAHHKQYYLEQAFIALCEDEYVEMAKKQFQWEDGIPSGSMNAQNEGNYDNKRTHEAAD